MFIHNYKEGKGYWVAAFGTGKMSVNQLADIAKWCYNTFGDPGTLRYIEDAQWGEVRFQNEADLALFLLKWNSS